MDEKKFRKKLRNWAKLNRHQCLDHHYYLAALEQSAREELEWLEDLKWGIFQLYLKKKEEIVELEKDRLELERALCPVERCPTKGAPKQRQRKEKKKSVEDLVKEIEGMPEFEKAKILATLDKDIEERR
jgi:hypothetical protein